MGHGSIAQAPAVNRTTLAAKGFTPEKIEAVEKGMKSAFDIKFVFNKWTLGEDFLTGALKVPAERLNDPSFELLPCSASARLRSKRPTCMSAGR